VTTVAADTTGEHESCRVLAGRSL